MTRVLLLAPDLGLEPGPTYRPGGLQTQGRLTARALAEAPGIRDLTIWSLADGAGVLPEVLPSLLARHRTAGQTLRVRGFAGRRMRLTAALLRARSAFDHVMFVHIGVGSLAALLPAGRHSVWQVGVDVWKPLKGLRRRAIAGASPLFSVSHATDRRMRELNPWAPPALVVHLGLEPDEGWGDGAATSAAPCPPPPSRRRRVALTAGRLSAEDRYKGYDTLLRAWPRVVAELPGAELWIVGDGNDRARLERLAAESGPSVAARVRFLGRVSHAELRHAYDSARIFALPSTGEGFGLVHLEAMRAGIPSIVCRDAASEVVLDQQTGLVVEPTPGPVGDALVRLLGNEALCDRLGSAAYARLEAHFTYEAFRDRLHAALAASRIVTP